jgi:hypothetical protein
MLKECITQNLGDIMDNFWEISFLGTTGSESASSMSYFTSLHWRVNQLTFASIQQRAVQPRVGFSELLVTRKITTSTNNRNECKCNNRPMLGNGSIQWILGIGGTAQGMQHKKNGTMIRSRANLINA